MQNSFRAAQIRQARSSLIQLEAKQFFMVVVCHSFKIRDNFCFEFPFSWVSLWFNKVWKLFMIVSYCALPHDTHKFSHGLTWCPYSFDSQKESEQQYVFSASITLLTFLVKISFFSFFACLWFLSNLLQTIPKEDFLYIETTAMGRV